VAADIEATTKAIFEPGRGLGERNQYYRFSDE
jgi:hypothetical protein